MRGFKIQSSPGRFFSFAWSFRPSREDDRKTPHFRVVFLAAIVLGKEKKGESTRSIQRVLKAGRSLPKRQPEKRFFYVLSLSVVRVRSRKKGARERGRRTALFSRLSLFARRERRTAIVVVVVIRNNEIVDRLFPEEFREKKGKSTKN